MNLLIATIILAAGANTDTEVSIRSAAASELVTLQAQARTELNREMAQDVRDQLKVRMEEKAAAALLSSDDVLLAGQPTRPQVKKK